MLAPIVLLCIWFGSVPFVTLVLAGAIGLAIEWAGLCRTPPTALPGLLVPLLVVLAGLAAAFGYAGPAILILLVSALVVGWLARRLLLASGIVYVGLAVVALLWLRGWDGNGRAPVFFVVLVVWSSDIGAYLAGRLLRGPKLAPALSPAKTWSGAAGGLIAAMLVGEALAARVTVATALFAALLAVACQAGDLLESGIKRHVGVKDSGRLIPGHGGLLDRLDGLLAAAPVAALVVLASREGLF